MRKDGVDNNGRLRIIKPDTPSGHDSAKQRRDLLKKNEISPEDIVEEYYDPTDPRFLPGSPTYIGSK